MPQIPTLETLTELANEAGGLVQAVHFGSDMGLEWKEDETPLTAADRAVRDLVAAFMTERYPHIPVIGEEGQLGRRTGADDEYYLLVDEVDGTWAFMLGVPVFASMFALMRGSEPVMSLICDPIGRRLYTAERGAGAYLNSKQIKVSHELPKVPSVGFVSWPKRDHPSDMIAPGLVHKVVVGLHEMGCIPVNMVTGGYLAAMVADGGRLAGMIFPGRTLHDCAPPDLLVREAGGSVTDFNGKPLWYGGTEVFGYVASVRPDIHVRLLDLVRQAL